MLYLRKIFFVFLVISLFPEMTARLIGRDLGSVMQDVQKEISRKLVLPEGYSVVYGGAYAEQQQSFSELLIILVSACLLVFCVILTLYRDFRVALAIIWGFIVAIPLLWLFCQQRSGCCTRINNAI
jgi:Cu/Ag efflux pump CusA